MPGAALKGHEHVRCRVDERQSAGQRRTGLGKGGGTRRVEDDEARLQGKPGEPLRIIGDAQRLDRHVLSGRDLRVHRHEIVVAVELYAVTAEIHERDGVWSRCLSLVEEVPQRAAQRFAVEVARAGDVEAGCLQRLCDEARVIGWRGKGGCLIGGVANHERDAFFGFRPRWRGKSEREEREAGDEQPRNGFHDGPDAGGADVESDATLRTLNDS